MPMTSAERVRKMRERRRAMEGKNLIVKRKKTRTEIERDSRERRKLRGQLLEACLENTDDQPLTKLPLNDCFQYPDYNKFKTAHNIFIRDFVANEFGSACCVCDRIWFKNDLKPLSFKNEELLQTKFPGFNCLNDLACICCHQSLRKGNIPTLSKFNGFAYPPIPPDLPKLDIISERLISPRVPFVQIRRLHHVHGQLGPLGQAINIPAVDLNTLVQQLPRNIDDDYCINVHIKKKKIHPTSYLSSLVNKKDIEIWLKCLTASPLHQMYDITVNESFFNENMAVDQIENDELTENIPIEESLLAQQHTLLLNIDKYLKISPGENNITHSLLFDQHAEEISFPTIYLGHFRSFCKELFRVTPFMMATSELRRSDRRGVTPHHLLYMAMKLMHIKVRDSLTLAFKNKDTKIARDQIRSDDFINHCTNNLAFLRCIPISTCYWAEKKEDLFAMIRQLGKPSLFLTVTANEIGWPSLLRILYKLKNSMEISEETVEQLGFIEKSALINDDSVTCAIYFNKMVNVIMNILQSKKSSPFGKYRVAHYFKRIAFDCGSPRAYILLWLDNAPVDPLGADNKKVIELTEQLTSVSSLEASENIKLQTHKHTIACYKGKAGDKKCKFDAPFMPCKYTTILTPMKQDEPGFSTYKQRYNSIRRNLEINDYADMNSFYCENQIISDEYYIKVLQAGINRPKVFLKRQPMEKWHIQFNPFIFNLMKSNMDIQFILEEYSCALYIFEYINKTDRGVSNLKSSMTQIMNEQPEFDIVDIAKKMSIDVLNAVEITSQEAAWYLLREPLSKASSAVVYIPTMKPIERQRVRKTQKGLDEIYADDGSSNILKDNWFDKYKKRPYELEEVNLAQFVANYTFNGESYTQRKEPRIIRCKNYSKDFDLNEYKREMVTLYIPFRNEENEIIAKNRFIQLYDANEMFILQRHKEFASNLDICKMIEICRELCGENGFNDDSAEAYNRIENSLCRPRICEMVETNQDADTLANDSAKEGRNRIKSSLSRPRIYETTETQDTLETYDPVKEDGLSAHLIIIKEEPLDENFEMCDERPDFDFETEEHPISIPKEIRIKEEPIDLEDTYCNDSNQTKEPKNSNKSESISNKSGCNSSEQKDCKIIDSLTSYISAEFKKNLQKLSPEKRIAFVSSVNNAMNEFMKNS